MRTPTFIGKEKNAPTDMTRIYTFIFIALVSIFAVIIRLRLFPFVSKDMTNFLFPWFDRIKSNGGFLALDERIGDYTPPYYYILAFLTYLPFDPNRSIKTVSCIFDFIMALYVLRIVYHCTDSIRTSAVSYAMALFLPTVVIDSSVWGQCDVIYTAFIVMSLYYFLVKKEYTAYALYGVAFSFKLQSIFVLPFILVLLLKKGISFKKIWAAPLAFLLMMVPALFLGDSIIRILGIYAGQTGEYGGLSMSIANIYSFLGGAGYPELPKAAVIFAGCVTMTFMYYMLIKNYKLNDNIIVTGMAFFAVLLPFVLPGMHERYYYAGVVLTLISAALNKKYIYILFIMEYVSTMSMTAFVFDNSIHDWTFIALFASAAVLLLFRLYDKLIKENEVTEEV